MECGADLALDYKVSTFEKDLEKLSGFHLIVDATGWQPELGHRLLKNNGTYVSVVNPLLSNVDKGGVALGVVKSLLDVAPELLKVRIQLYCQSL